MIFTEKRRLRCCEGVSSSIKRPRCSLFVPCRIPGLG